MSTAWWLGLLGTAVVVAALLSRALVAPPQMPRDVMRFDLPSDSLAAIYNRPIAVSPNGRYIATTTTAAGGTTNAMTVRSIDESASRTLPDASNARDPAFAPDSASIAFWSTDQIKRIPVDGGPAIAIGPVPSRPLGMSWADDGFIYFGRGTEGIWKVNSAGGEPAQVVAVDDGEYAHGPQLLPGGQWLLFTRASSINGWNDATIVAVSLTSDEERILVEPGHDGRWVPGFLTYVHDTVLFAVAFDLDAVSVTGDPRILAESVRLSVSGMTGAAFYDVSNTGLLAYNGGPDTTMLQMSWLSGETITPLPAAPSRIDQVKLSPDGRRVAARVFENGWNIVLYDVDRPVGTRLTSQGTNRDPIWSRDGEWVYYAADTGGDFDVWRRRSDLSGTPELVYDADGNQLPAGLTADGWLVFIELDPNGSDLGRVNLADTAQVEMIVESPQDEPDASISPDGRFLAYGSFDGGAWQVRVVDLATGRRSTAGAGFSPAWSLDGRTILFMWADSLMGVDATLQPDFATGEPFSLLDLPFVQNRCCDLVSRDRVLLLNRPEGASPLTRISVVVNWPETIR